MDEGDHYIGNEVCVSCLCLLQTFVVNLGQSISFHLHLCTHVYSIHRHANTHTHTQSLPLTVACERKTIACIFGILTGINYKLIGGSSISIC